MEKAHIVLKLSILFILTILLLGCDNNGGPPYVEYESVQELLDNMELDVLIPTYLPEHLNPKLNLGVETRYAIDYESCKKERQTGYSLIYTTMHYEQLAEHLNVFHNIYINVDDEQIKKVEYAPLNEYEYNNIVINTEVFMSEVLTENGGISGTVLVLRFGYNEMHYKVYSRLYGNISNEMLMEVEEELLRVAEGMLMAECSK